MRHQLQAFNAFRRRPVLEPPPRVEILAPAPAGPTESGARLDAETIDHLEADLLKAIAAVTGAIGVASGEVTRTRDDVGQIQANIRDLAEAGRGAAAQTSALAASTEELAATSGEINGAMSHASRTVVDAVGSARDAHALIAELARASEEIVGIVDTIAAVARQTNLLALNATIEAARAGAAGRGFAVVASEVKALSVETGNAANDIRSRIANLRERAGASISAVERVVTVIDGVQPVFDTVRAAVDEQNASIGEVARRATEASGFVDRMSERAERVDAAAQDAAERVRHAGEAATAAETLAKALGQRFVAVMRQSEVGDRRRFDRLPTDLKVTLRTGGQNHATHTVDVSRGGVLVAAVPGLTAIRSGTRLDLELERVGAFGARVLALSPMGIHCAFEGLQGEAEQRVARLVAEIEAGYRPLIEFAKDTAGRLTAALERAVEENRLSRELLFDTAYRPVPGTDPQQYETAYLAVFEDLLPPIQEPALSSDSRMVFCIAIDRNGYIPVHNRKYSVPQRPGETVWNTANSRNKRIFDDRAGITAARSTRPFLVQAYARDMGGQTVMLREVDVPLRLFGRHWGGLRTAYRL